MKWHIARLSTRILCSVAAPGKKFSVTPEITASWSCRTITYSYDTAGRQFSAIDLANSVDWVVSAHYTPFGSQASLQTGNGQPPLNTTYFYNARLQPCRLTVSNYVPSSCPGTGLPSVGLNLDYYYGNLNNGNIDYIYTLKDTYLSQNFTYDSLNRIATAYTNATYATRPGECWAETYGYDAWGNLTTLSMNTQSAYVGCLNEIGLATTATSKNQLAFLTYDAAGNVMFDPSVFGGNYTYDAEITSSTTFMVLRPLHIPMMVMASASPLPWAKCSGMAKAAMRPL